MERPKEGYRHLISFKLANISWLSNISSSYNKSMEFVPVMLFFFLSHGAPICTLFVESAITFMICGMGKAQGKKADG